MKAITLAILFCFATIVVFQAGHGNALGQAADEKTVAALIQVLRTLEKGINTADVDLAMSVLHRTVSIQAGSAKKKMMYSWDAYKEHLVEWVKGVKDFEHYGFRKITVQGDKASLVCDVNLLALTKKQSRPKSSEQAKGEETGQWKMRTVLDVYHEFVRDQGKWCLSKRTYE
jgi:hypothetical protein